MQLPFRTLSAGYWRHHRARALLIIATVTLGVAAWVATSALNGHLDRGSRDAATPLAGAADLYVSNGDNGVPADLADKLAQVPGVRSVRSLVSERVRLPGLHDQTALLLGTAMEGDLDIPGWDVQVVRSPTPATFRTIFLARKIAFIGKGLAKQLHSEVDHFDVLAGGRVERLTCAGMIVKAHGPALPLEGNVIVMSCGDAAAVLGRPDFVSRIDLSLESGTDRAEICRRLDSVLQDAARVWTPEEHDHRARELLTGITTGLSLCGIGGLVVGLFLISSTLTVSVAERRFEIGVLRSLGATRAQIGALFVCEALALGVVGSCLALPLGLALAHLGLGLMREVLSDVFLPLPALRLEVASHTWIGAIAGGLSTVLLASVIPALRAAREDPVAALRKLPAGQECIHMGIRIAGALGLMLAAISCLALKGFLPARIGAFAALLMVDVAALAAIPLLAGALARLIVRPLAQRFLGIEDYLAADNLVRSPARTGLVMTAFAAGIALFLQTGGLIRSNEMAIGAWVDHSIAGDLFVTAGGPLTASGRTTPMPEAVGTSLLDASPGLTVMPMRFRHLDWQQAGHSARILLMALDASTYYALNKDRQPPLPELDLYRQLAQTPEAALVSENFAALHGVGIGDSLTLPGTAGPVRLRVLGTVVDYSCSRGVVVVDRSRCKEAFNVELVDVFGVYLPPGADIEAVQRRLQQATDGGPETLCIMARGEVRGHIMGMIDRLYGLAYTQEVVIAAVALLGVVTALLISVLQRRREFGLLRAIGATPGQVVRTVLAESLLMGGLGTALGLAAGLPMVWYAVRVILFDETGYLLPIAYPWSAAVAIGCLALVGAALAGLGPALNAAKLEIAKAVAYE